jgi:hypothetical protein
MPTPHCRHHEVGGRARRTEPRRGTERVGQPVDWTDRLAWRFASTVLFTANDDVRKLAHVDGKNQVTCGRPRKRERHFQGIGTVGDGFTCIEALEDQRRDLIEIHGASLSARVPVTHVGPRDHCPSRRGIGTTHTVFGPHQNGPSASIRQREE